MIAPWLEELRNTSIFALVRRHGVSHRGNRLWPCPSCNEETASRSSRRQGPVAFDHLTWKCWRCGEKGGAVELAAWILLGCRKPTPGDRDGWKRFREAVTGQLSDVVIPPPSLRTNLPGPTPNTPGSAPGFAPASSSASSPTSRSAQAGATAPGSVRTNSPGAIPSSALPSAPASSAGTTSARVGSVRTNSPGAIQPDGIDLGPVYARPDHDELKALWSRCRRVDEDAEVAAWLESRRLKPYRIAGLDLARALPSRWPRGVAYPRWARFLGKPWYRSGHRLVVRCLGPTGAEGAWQWSLRARNIRPGVASHRKSASAACGPGSASSLIYADALARRMLVGATRNPRRGGCYLNTRLVIVEGEPDWLTWSSYEDRDWGVIGVWNGAWSEAFAARIPRGATVAIRTHRDKAGHDYADKIEASLHRRPHVAVFRLLGDSAADENDEQIRAGWINRDPLEGLTLRQPPAPPWR